MEEMTIEQFEDILYDGDDKTLADLPNRVTGVGSYEYNEEYRSFVVKLGPEISRAFGTLYIPNCIKVFGTAHSF